MRDVDGCLKTKCNLLIYRLTLSNTNEMTFICVCKSVMCVKCISFFMKNVSFLLLDCMTFSWEKFLTIKLILAVFILTVKKCFGLLYSSFFNKSLKEKSHPKILRYITHGLDA